MVDNGEFIATRHCPAPECRLIMTLLLELITDYSREVILVTVPVHASCILCHMSEREIYIYIQQGKFPKLQRPLCFGNFSMEFQN